MRHMTDQNIAELLGKYLNGTITIEKERTIDEWYDSIACEEGTSLSEVEMLGVKEKIWRTIKARTIDAEHHEAECFCIGVFCDDVNSPAEITSAR